MTEPEDRAFLEGVQFALLWLNVTPPRRVEVQAAAEATVKQWKEQEPARDRQG